MDDYGWVEVVTFVTVVSNIGERRTVRRRVVLARFSCTRQSFRGLVDEAIEIVRANDTIGNLKSAVIESVFTPDPELYLPSND